MSEANKQVLQGGCHCGDLRYEVAEPFYHRTLCHCTMCRGTSGAPMVAWFSVRGPAFRWLQGTPQAYRASGEATRHFCGRCGTQLAFRRDGEDEVDVTIGSLDDAAAMAPDDQTYTRSALAWMAQVPALPRHATTREADAG